MRLLLPQLDRERQSYGLKEKNLGKLYVEILQISETSEDAKRLIDWKKPNEKFIAGDFGLAVYQSLQNRCPEKGSMTIEEINTSLDLLNVATDKSKRIEILKNVLIKTTALEQKWFVRIILKQLKMGMSENTIFNYFHKDALTLWNLSSDLKKICEDLKNPEKLISLQQQQILFQPIKPMLSGKYPIEDICKVLKKKPFVIETKFDGERIQIHKNGAEIKIFSRFYTFIYSF